MSVSYLFSIHTFFYHGHMIYNSFVFKHWHFMIKLYPTGLLILLLPIIIRCHILPLISLKADLVRHDFSTTDCHQTITEFRNSDYIMCHFPHIEERPQRLKSLSSTIAFSLKSPAISGLERVGNLRDNFTSEFQIGSPSALRGIANSDQSRVGDYSGWAEGCLSVSLLVNQADWMEDFLLFHHTFRSG